MLATINALIQKSIYVEFIKISIGGGIESNGGDTNIGQHQHRHRHHHQHQHQNNININGDNTNGPPAVDEKDGFVKLPSPTPTSSRPLLNSHYITYFDRLTNRKVFRCKKQGAKNCDFLWPGFLDMEIHDNMMHGGQHETNLWIGSFFYLFCGKDPRYAYICIWSNLLQCLFLCCNKIFEIEILLNRSYREAIEGEN